jgi:tetratricopeptide (TPR) repeat protein
MNGKRHVSWNTLALLIATFLFTANSVLWAEAGVLVVDVEDVHGHPVSGVQIGVKGDGGFSITGDDGKARIALAKDTKEKSWVVLQIMSSPRGTDFVMVSPWDSRTLVPSFENESENFVSIVVVERGERGALENDVVLKSLAEQINKGNAPKAVGNVGQEDAKAILAAVAKQYGLEPEEVDKALRTWKTNDPYEAGLAALYRRNYPIATMNLKESLQNSEAKFAADQKAVADTAFFLGQSLFEEGKFRESAAALQRCFQLMPNNAIVMHNLALSLLSAGDYAQAEPLLRRALTIDLETLGPDHPDVATIQNSLAWLLTEKGDYAEAEAFCRKALAIREKAFGRDQPPVAATLDNLASLLELEGHYTEAEPLCRRALDIHIRFFGPDDAAVSDSLNALGFILQGKGDYTTAEMLFRRALAIRQKTLAADHPAVAASLENLASLLEYKGDKADYAEAEDLCQKALDIDEKVLGPNHPDVATGLKDLAWLVALRGDYAQANRLYGRALDIYQKALGADNPNVADVLTDMGTSFYWAGDYVNAERLYRQALAIHAKVMGEGDFTVGIDWANLGSVFAAKGDFAEAEPMYRKALAISERTLGAHHPTTELIRNNLKHVTENLH